MTLKEVFEKSVQFFKDKKIESARLDTELLLSHALKIQRLQIYLKFEQPLSDSEIQLCREVVRRRSLGEPVAYITGEKGFYGEEFVVGPGVLVPRPETELLVEESLKHIRERKISDPRVLDLGAGSGCIGLSILKNDSNAKLVSLEKSPEAFNYLNLNVQKFSMAEKVEAVQTDVLTYVPSHSFDVIVANPPYIDIEDTDIQKSVKEFEPKSALFSSQQGLCDLQNWLKKYLPCLRPSGLFLMELGHKQGQIMKDFALKLDVKNNCKIEILKDLAGLDRVLKVIREN